MDPSGAFADAGQRRYQGLPLERRHALQPAAPTGDLAFEVLPLVGGFAGVMAYPGSAPLLAATMDGVGTKLHLALRAGRLEDAAADLVYHGANDLLVHGARPLAFLDYVAQARLAPDVVLAVVRGLARACREVGAALLGGETAEMPDTYLPDVVDVAGCMLGTVEPGALLDGLRVRAGDRILGLAGSGLHTNGYALARRVLAASGLALDAPLPGGDGGSVGAALLQPHRWYGRSLLPLLSAGGVHALAHVTGGGIAGNLVRVADITQCHCGEQLFEVLRDDRLAAGPAAGAKGTAARRGLRDRKLHHLPTGVAAVRRAPRHDRRTQSD